MRKLLEPLTVLTALNIFTLPVSAELGSDAPSDAQLLTERVREAGSAGSVIFDIAVPPAGTMLRPVERIPRDKFGGVGPFPLQLQDLPALILPDATLDERQKVLVY
jgi:hypothetical protein